jgi:hypothetical protein
LRRPHAITIAANEPKIAGRLRALDERRAACTSERPTMIAARSNPIGLKIEWAAEV